MESTVFVLVVLCSLMRCDVDCVRTVRESKQVTLSVFPPEPIVEGGTVNIQCKAPPGVKQPFDILRLVRQIDGQSIEITTNNVLADLFHQTGRYQIIEWDDDAGQVDLRIQHIQGVDGGNIGCLLLTVFEPKPADAFVDLIVNVPPRRVEILHQSQDGDTYRASEAELLHLPQGVETTLTCRVTVTESDFAPVVIVTSDGKDVTSRFTKNSTTIVDSDDSEPAPQGFLHFSGRSYDYQLKVDPTGSDVASLVNGKNMTCSANMPHFSPIMASVRLEVAYKPQVSCQAEYDGMVGHVDFDIVCTGRSHPGPHRVVWSWMSSTSHTSQDDNNVDKVLPPGGSTYGEISAIKRVEISNGNINEEDLRPFYTAITSDVGKDQHEFRLRIARLESRDFRPYELEVSNEIGTTLVHFTISQVHASTPNRPSTKKTDIEGNQPAEPWRSATGAGLATHFNMATFVSAIATCYGIVHLVQFSRDFCVRT